MKVLKHKIQMSVAILAFLFILILNANAQRGEFGLRFMPTYSSTNIQFSSGGEVQGNATLGFGAGAVIGFNFTDYVGIQGEIIYSSTTQKYKEKDIEREINLKYVNIPLMLSLNTGKLKPVNFNIVAGPQIGISVGSSISGVATDSLDAVLSVKKGDLGVAFGAGFDFGLNPAKTIRLSIGYRGVRGLIDISDDNNSIDNDSYYVLDKAHTKSNAAYIGLSYLF
ncbi:MAG: PorT family protein [Saprospiraceae bacterium]|nr:PorT family protein [Saprospiraceae bacterium]